MTRFVVPAASITDGLDARILDPCSQSGLDSGSPISVEVCLIAHRATESMRGFQLRDH